MDQFERELVELVKEQNSRAVFAKVFDNKTISTVHALAGKGHFDKLEFLINVGKEAHVFRAVDASGNFKAVKIYKIETSDFNKMGEYVEGDYRFKNVGHNKMDLVYAWTRKEFKNLMALKEAGVKVPLPHAFQENVLVMEFIGTEGNASLTAREKPFADSEKFYETITSAVAKMVSKAKLIHADLSEYNILNKEEEAVIIDCGQAVPTNHPRAKEFFERDLQNLTHYFNKIGIKKSKEEVYADIKSKSK